jgi:nucleotide-binding universal stress UspA family protein
LNVSQGTARGQTIRVSRILAPTDFSLGAKRALLWAVTLNTAFHAELIVLHVVDLDALAYLNLGGDPALGGAPQPVSAEMLERLRADAEQALARFTESFPGIHPMLREGSPREAILQVAEEVGTDLIVMGTHGRSGLARVAFGSVADHIIRHSKVPVLTVREGDAT